MRFGDPALSLPLGHLGKARENPLAHADRRAALPRQRVAQALVARHCLPAHVRGACPARGRGQLAGEALERPAAFHRLAERAAHLLNRRAGEPTLGVARLDLQRRGEIRQRVRKIVQALADRRAQHQNARRRTCIPPRRERGLRVAQVARVGLGARPLDVAARGAGGKLEVARVARQLEPKLPELPREAVRGSYGQRFEDLFRIRRNERCGNARSGGEQDDAKDSHAGGCVRPAAWRGTGSGPTAG